MFTTTSLVTLLHNKVDLLHPFQPLPQPPSLLITINVCCIYKVQELNIDHRSMCTKPLQSCPTLCDPMDCSPPSSSVCGLLQSYSNFLIESLGFSISICSIMSSANSDNFYFFCSDLDDFFLFLA